MDVQLVMPDRLAAKHPASAVGATPIRFKNWTFKVMQKECDGLTAVKSVAFGSRRFGSKL